VVGRSRGVSKRSATSTSIDPGPSGDGAMTLSALAVSRLSSARGLATSIEPFVDEGFGKYAGTNKAELRNTLPGGHEWEIVLVAQGFLVKQPPSRCNQLMDANVVSAVASAL